jgi:hypothetical protein
MLVTQLGNTICWGFHSEIVFCSIEELITGFLLALTDFHSQSISRSRLQLGQHLDLWFYFFKTKIFAGHFYFDSVFIKILTHFEVS